MSQARTRNRIHPKSYTDCWHWPNGKTSDGYGIVHYNGKTTYTHRLFYEALIGKIPSGLTIDHLCLQKDCFNPRHMEVVTLSENGKRGMQKRCILGHIMTKENIYQDPSRPNSKRCRDCRKLAHMRWKIKR